MKRQLIHLLYAVLMIFALSGSIADVSNSEVSAIDLLNKRPTRSLLSIPPEQEATLFAGPDGTVHLMESKSKEVIWSFPSGGQIYSSYQAPIDQDNDKDSASEMYDDFFIDCGDDWELYMHSRYLGKMKLPLTGEEYIKSLPHFSEEGIVTLGSKNITVFVVNARTGRVVNTYSSSGFTYGLHRERTSVLSKKNTEKLVDSGSMSLKNAEIPLYITRTDYTVQSFALTSDKVLWNVSFSEIRAVLLCQGFRNPYGGVLIDSQSGSNSQMLCHSEAIVHRIRDIHPSGLLEARYTEILEKLSRSNVPKMLPPQTKDDIVNYNNDDKNPKSIEISPQPNNSNMVMYLTLFLIGTIFLIVIILRQSRNQDSQVSHSKRKRGRKLGSSDDSVNVVKKDNTLLSDSEMGLKVKKANDGNVNGRRVGKLLISNTEIAKGSNGTIVLEGIYEGRSVAVKRLVKSHHDVAYKEIQNLIASDRHPNIVRWYGVEYDQDFVYLSLERCDCTLNDVIQVSVNYSQNPVYLEGQATRSIIENKVRLDSMKHIIQDIDLWKTNGYPSVALLKMMRDVVSGLVHLHELGIIHRDLKPQNVLIVKHKFLCAKLSDMGISKRLVEDMSSLGNRATGSGSSGWQAPEQLLHGRQTRALDLFSLGCVLFFCITGGRHPFGVHLERDINIVKNKVDLFLVEHIPEAVNLFSRLLDPVPELRPKASEVLNHPLFWDSEMRLSFLRDTSDRVELENRETDSDLFKDLEGIAPIALGTRWDAKMESAFIANIGHYRRYKYDSVRDLLRVMRNKLNHYRELPKEIQEILGPVPDGFDGYFASRFPRLLIEAYRIMYKYCREEKNFHKYFKNNQV